MLAASAWACTNHMGNIWFCSTSSSCSQSNSITPAASASAWVDGGGLLASRSDINVRYAATATPADDACHTGTSFGTGSTDTLGSISGTIAGTTPSAGNWTFCATNGTGDNYSNHLALTLN